MAKKLKDKVQLPFQDKYNWTEVDAEAWGISCVQPLFIGYVFEPGTGERQLKVSILTKDVSAIEPENALNYQKILNLVTGLAKEKIGAEWIVSDFGPYPYDTERDMPLDDMPFEEFMKRHTGWWRTDYTIASHPFGA